MHRLSLHVAFFTITLIGVSALLLAARPVPLAIGHWMLHQQAADFLFLFIAGPWMLLVIACTPRAWPLWFRKILVGVVSWAMSCGGMIVIEVNWPRDGLLVGSMAVLLAIAIPWILISNTLLAASDPS